MYIENFCYKMNKSLISAHISSSLDSQESGLKKNYSVNDIQANDEINSVTAKIIDKLGLN